MEHSTLFLGAGLTAGIAAVVSVWGYVKTIIWKFFNLFIDCVTFTDTPERYMLCHMLRKYDKLKLYDKNYVAVSEMVHRKQKYIGTEQFGQTSLLFWKGWFPVFYSPQSKKPVKTSNGGESLEPNYNDGSGSSKDQCSYTFLRGSFDFDQELKDAYAHYYQKEDEEYEEAKEMDSRFCIIKLPSRKSEKDKSFRKTIGAWHTRETSRIITEEKDNIGPKKEVENPTELLVFPTHVRDLIEEAKHWRNSESWYNKKQIPWKRGWLLYGPPGTGKSALSRALAEELGIPIIVMNMAEMSNVDLEDSWVMARQNSPCVVLIEDIDNIFHGRNYIVKKNNLFPDFSPMKGRTRAASNAYPDDDDMPQQSSGSMGITFDNFLNCLDGIERNDGIFTIITTNDISKIDSALGLPQNGSLISTRPGRLDKAIELTYMQKREKHIFAERMLEEYPELLKVLKEEIDNADLVETPAQFQEKCSQLALAEYWKLLAAEANTILKS